MYKFLKKHLSNIIFVVILGLILYPPTRTKIIRQISFSPSINKEVERETLESYNWMLQSIITKDKLDFRDTKEKIIFVSFWATWCPSCRAEIPMIQDLYKDYKDKMIFILVTNESREKVMEYYTKNNYNLPTYNSLSNPPKNFLKTNKIPYSFLIDTKGKILIEKKGPANWNSTKVRNLIDNSLQK